MRNFFSASSKQATASASLLPHRVRSFTLRASRPMADSPSLREKPTSSSSLLTLGPRLMVLRKRGCLEDLRWGWRGETRGHLHSFRLMLWCLSKEN